MSEELLVRHCSPTLAGMKTGNMFTCTFHDHSAMKDCIRCWNKRLTKKGLRILPLRFRENRALVYVYRPALLSHDLQHQTANSLLQARGYPVETANRCITCLIGRLRECEEFPHEIGLFLGYPPEDVCGFIENKAEGCKQVGCWKVYGDAETAQKTFARYKKCTHIYCSHYARGKSIERLTVAG